MKIIYIPLDERPCNLRYPQDIAKINPQISVVVPSPAAFGLKKQKADTELIKKFIVDNATDADVLICSIDMLCYGGLIPSRLHHQQLEQVAANLSVLTEAKELNPNLKIYPFSSIMRTPGYSSNDEEPDYYQEYGYELYKTKYLTNKQQRSQITADELLELEQLKPVPAEIVSDYETRRETNNKNLINVLELLEQELFERLVIFQDDSAPFGYTAIDQRAIKQEIMSRNLNAQVHIYPGADEVGCSLLLRAYNDFYNKQPKIYCEYSSVLGPSIIPLYEDRPMYETLKQHINIIGGVLVNDVASSTAVLMINSPGNKMQESWDQFTNKDLQYDSYRTLGYFVDKIEYFVNCGKQVMVADVAYSNGGDLELVELIDNKCLFNKLYSYAAWNTHANTLGTVLAMGLINQDINEQTVKNIQEHILEDAIYQAKIRMDVNLNQLPLIDLNYFDLKDKQQLVVEIELEKVKPYLNRLSIFEDLSVEDIAITHPWNRMFEVDLTINK